MIICMCFDYSQSTFCVSSDTSPIMDFKRKWRTFRLHSLRFRILQDLWESNSSRFHSFSYRLKNSFSYPLSTISQGVFECRHDVVLRTFLRVVRFCHRRCMIAVSSLPDFVSWSLRWLLDQFIPSASDVVTDPDLPSAFKWDGLLYDLRAPDTLVNISDINRRYYYSVIYDVILKRDAGMFLALEVRWSRYVVFFVYKKFHESFFLSRCSVTDLTRSRYEKLRKSDKRRYRVKVSTMTFVAIPWTRRVIKSRSVR